MTQTEKILRSIGKLQTLIDARLSIVSRLAPDPVEFALMVAISELKELLPKKYCGNKNNDPVQESAKKSGDATRKAGGKTSRKQSRKEWHSSSGE